MAEGAPRPAVYTKLAVNHVRRAKNGTDTDSRGLLKKAIELYEQAYERHGSPVALYRIGQLYLRLGEYEKAISSFEQAIQEGSPDDFFVAPSKTIVLKLTNQRS
jgi:tetratricopeptide (TPR) repeat protein